MRLWIASLLLAACAWGQDAAPFSFTCTPEDVHDFGLTCDEDEPCPVFLELVGVDASGSTVFLTGNLHTQTTTLYGLLLASEDGGLTFTEPAKRLKSAAVELIQFADLQHGWASGVMIEPLPRDPFFLITSDGGKTWRRRAMFEDTHYGSVSQFAFDSATAGELIIDGSQGNTKRYELYSTMTGGESWDVKEMTRTLPKMSKVRKDQPVWRVRVDNAAKAYRLEKRVAGPSGDRWETLTSFPVIAGECK